MQGGGHRMARLMQAPIGSLDRQDPNTPRAILAVLLATTLGTLLAAVIKPLAPSDSLALAYMPPVVVVAIRWGLAWALATIVLSVLVVDVAFIEPQWELGSKGRHGVALAIFAAVALIISGLAERAQARAILAERRRRDADLLAELAQALYSARDDERAMFVVSEGLGRALGIPEVVLRPPGEPARAGEVAMPLWFGDEVVATMALPEGITEERTGDLSRISAGLGSLLAAVRRRIALEGEAAQAEVVRRSEATKTTVLRAISHDLRSPLAALRAAAQGLRSERLEPESRRELIELVGASSDELIEIVENLLTLARIDAGAVNPQLQWTDVGEVVAAEVARCPGLAVTLELEQLPLVRTDGAQLGRILANLLQNAERHGLGTGVRIAARAEEDHVVISVIDSGPGFGNLDPELVFEPFNSSDHPMGLGLGLTIVRGFTEALGGTVAAAAEPGGGARFTVTVPAEAPPATPAGMESA